MKLLLPILVFTIGFTAFAQPLDLKEIMSGKEFIGYWPENHYWHVNGEQICFSWNPENEVGSSQYTYSTKNQKVERVSTSDRWAAIPYDKTQQAYSIQYFTSHGDLCAYDKNSGQFKLLIDDALRISDVQRLQDANLIAFRKDNNLYLYNSKNGSVKRLTDLNLKDEPKETEGTPHLIEQQEELFQYIRDEKAEQDFKDGQSHEFGPKKHYLGNKRIDFIKIDPTGTYILLSISNRPNITLTEVQHHVSENGYAEMQKARPKVGAEEPLHELYKLTLDNDSLIPLSIDELTDIKKKPSYLAEYGDETTEYENNRKVIFHEPYFNSSGKAILDIRAYDNKDRWLAQVDKNTTGLIAFEQQHDEAWIGGPGVSYWNMVPGVVGWFNNTNSIYFQSEETGFSHLYRYNFEKKKKTAITSGEFEIQSVELAIDGASFFIHANKTHPGSVGFYQYILKNESWIAISEQDNGVQVELAPDQRKMAILKSEQNEPWELWYGDRILKRTWIQVTKSQSEKFAAYDWRKVGVRTFKGQDGKDVYARVYEPNESVKNGAAVIFVHGAGYLQNAHHRWSGYYREYMFHNLLCDLGFTVLDIDYRASAGYGRDYRTAIYRHMGGWDLNDQVSGKQFLVDSLGIDANRVGMYGGSYGGFITLMALLTKPDEFACGAALRSVTDWAHYNHEYTSNILNYPSMDPEAYRKSSPIYFAENLNKPLVMLHGMVDDNVQFQDVVRLSQRFIELGKEDWELAVFPVEAHGFVKSYSWYDEYRRILELMNENLLR